MTKLYHADVFMPWKLQNTAECIKFNRLTWSRHAQLELLNDKYGLPPAEKIPKTFDGRFWTVVELEATPDRIVKYVFRTPVDTTRSLVVVLRPVSANEAVVVTAWTNLNTDKHNSLDRSKYASA